MANLVLGDVLWDVKVWGLLSTRLQQLLLVPPQYKTSLTSHSI